MMKKKSECNIFTCRRISLTAFFSHSLRQSVTPGAWVAWPRLVHICPISDDGKALDLLLGVNNGSYLQKSLTNTYNSFSYKCHIQLYQSLSKPILQIHFHLVQTVNELNITGQKTCTSQFIMLFVMEKFTFKTYL